MKRIIGIALLAFSVQVSNAQQVPELITDVDVTVSEPFEYSLVPELTIWKDDHYFAVNRGEDGMEFLKFDISGTPKLVDKNIDSDFPENFDIDAIESLNDQWHVFYSVFDEEEEVERLYVQELDLENLAFKDEPREFIKTEGRLTGSVFFKQNLYVGMIKVGEINAGVVDKFSIIKSRDESKRLAYYIYEPDKARDAISHLKFGFFVFDNDLNEIWHSVVEMPYTEKKMNFLDIALTNDGDVFMAADIFDDDSKKYFRRGELNHHPEILAVKAGSETVETYSVDPQGKAFSDVSLFENLKGEMTFVGLYTEFDELDHAQGFALIDIDKNGNVSDFAALKIPIDVLGQFESPRVLKKLRKKEKKGKLEKVVFEFASIQDILYLDDGGLIINAEQAQNKAYYSSMRGSRQELTYYRDILACKITPDKEFDWIMKLGKNQGGGSGGKRTMGFEHIRSDEYRYYFFIDHYDNEKVSLDVEPRSYTENNMCIGRIAAYRINDSTGKLEKVSVLDTRKVKLDPNDKDEVHIKQFRPGNIRLVDEDTFVFDAYKGAKENVLIKFQVLK